MLKKQGFVGKLIAAIILVLLGFFFFFPLFWLVTTSFKSLSEAFTIPPKIFNFHFTLMNYVNGFTTGKNMMTSATDSLVLSSTPRYFFNSIIIAGSSTLLALFFGTLSAYAFSRFEVKGKSDILFFILSQKFLPPVVVIIPIFMMYRFMNLIDTYTGMILLYTSFNLPFVVWMVKGFMDDIPTDYEEAALVDGYSRIQAFIRITLPQALPGLAATAVFCLITIWNEYVFSAILTGDRAKTAPVAIASSIGTQMTDWGIVAALTTVFLIPVIIFTLLVRNYLLRGVTFGVIRR